MDLAATSRRVHAYAETPRRDSNMCTYAPGGIGAAGYWTPQLLRSPRSHRVSVISDSACLNDQMRPRSQTIRSTGDLDDGYNDDVHLYNYGADFYSESEDGYSYNTIIYDGTKCEDEHTTETSVCDPMTSPYDDTSCCFGSSNCSLTSLCVGPNDKNDPNTRARTKTRTETDNGVGKNINAPETLSGPYRDTLSHAHNAIRTDPIRRIGAYFPHETMRADLNNRARTNSISPANLHYVGNSCISCTDSNSAGSDVNKYSFEKHQKGKTQNNTNPPNMGYGYRFDVDTTSNRRFNVGLTSDKRRNDAMCSTDTSVSAETNAYFRPISGAGMGDITDTLNGVPYVGARTCGREEVGVDERDRRIMYEAQLRLLKEWMTEKARTKADDAYNDQPPDNDPPPIPPRRYNHTDYLDTGRSDNATPESALSCSDKSIDTKTTQAQMTSQKPPLRRHRILRKHTSTPSLYSTELKRPTSTTSIDRVQTSDSYPNKEELDNFIAPRNNGHHPAWSDGCQMIDNVSVDTVTTSPVSPNAPSDQSSDRPLSMVDIVGESFQARYPWQRDAYTQCDIERNLHIDRHYSAPSTYPASQYGDHAQQNIQRKGRSRMRPQSVGDYDTYYHGEEHGRACERAGRLSEPNLTQRGLYRKRAPVMAPDDGDSVSDLGSISETPPERVPHGSRVNSLESAAITEELSARLQCRLEKEAELSVLTSPSVSPVMWSHVPDVIINPGPHQQTEESDGDLRSSYRSMDYLSVPRKHVRRRNSASFTEGSDDSDREISPPVARRGRRAAIVDTKNFGDVSPTNLSPDVSPSESCDEGDGGGTLAERLRRRRSSTELTSNVYPGDLLVQEHHKKLIKRNTISDFYASRNGSTTNLTEDPKKKRQPFSLVKLMKSRSKESLVHLGDVLQQLKPSEFKDNHLAVYKNLHWSDLIASTDRQPSAEDALRLPDVERKRRESVWELFKSELVFLIDHLMVLKHCFLEPLKKVQVEGFLMYAEPAEIFGNLDELCYVSYTFCKDFIASLVRDMSGADFGRTHILIKAFQRFSAHSKDGSVYHTYCLNYTNALSYLEKLRKNEDFCEFEKRCEQDPRCNRLQLADLLIGPMQHCTKLPLLLYNIKKYTEDPLEKCQIEESIEKVELSLKQLEDKMKWLKNFERVQEVQRHLVWPSVTDIDSRAFVPEYLKPKLMHQPCERLLACPRRQLLHEGPITLTESTKSYDAYLFLFDDILLITKIKKPNRKKQGGSDPLQQVTGLPDKQTYVVHRQPIALDRLGLHDVSAQEAAANGVKCALVLVQISRFQQIIDVFTLQAATESVKTVWLSQIRDAKTHYCNLSRARADSTKENEDPSTLVIVNNNNNNNNNVVSSTNDTPDCAKRRSSGGKKSQHTKTMSVDTIFL